MKTEPVNTSGTAFDVKCDNPGTLLLFKTSCGLPIVEWAKKLADGEDVVFFDVPPNVIPTPILPHLVSLIMTTMEGEPLPQNASSKELAKFLRKITSNLMLATNDWPAVLYISPEVFTNLVITCARLSAPGWTVGTAFSKAPLLSMRLGFTDPLTWEPPQVEPVTEPSDAVMAAMKAPAVPSPAEMEAAKASYEEAAYLEATKNRPVTPKMSGLVDPAGIPLKVVHAEDTAPAEHNPD